jgi:putative transcriptional regulator
MKKSILEAVHETAKGLHENGLMNLQTMREFDALCLPAVQPLSPKEIKALRLREKLSQPVFAEYINASPSTVKKWETGEKHPTGPALKLLNLIAARGLGILSVVGA